MESPDAVETIVPVSLAKSPGINEIIQLCQSHIEESVILAHIRSSTIAYAPTADEIIYLNDIGISSRIVTALIQRGRRFEGYFVNAGSKYHRRCGNQFDRQHCSWQPKSTAIRPASGYPATEFTPDHKRSR